MTSKSAKNPPSRKRSSRNKDRLVSAQPDARRDKDTNVYIPTDAEVAALKSWSEFCKL